MSLSLEELDDALNELEWIDEYKAEYIWCINQGIQIKEAIKISKAAVKEMKRKSIKTLPKKTTELQNLRQKHRQKKEKERKLIEKRQIDTMIEKLNI